MSVDAARADCRIASRDRMLYSRSLGESPQQAPIIHGAGCAAQEEVVAKACRIAGSMCVEPLRCNAAGIHPCGRQGIEQVLAGAVAHAAPATSWEEAPPRLRDIVAASTTVILYCERRGCRARVEREVPKLSADGGAVPAQWAPHSAALHARHFRLPHLALLIPSPPPCLRSRPRA